MLVRNYIRGTALVWAGIFLLFLVAGTIVIRVCLGGLGLYLMHYGLLKRGIPPVHSLILVVLGALLFLWAAGSSIIRVCLGMVALYTIWCGVRLRGTPSLRVFIYQ